MQDGLNQLIAMMQ